MTNPENQTFPHNWVPSTLGHGESMCSRCLITNREAAVLGTLNDCDKHPDKHRVFRVADKHPNPQQKARPKTQEGGDS